MTVTAKMAGALVAAAALLIAACGSAGDEVGDRTDDTIADGAADSADTGRGSEALEEPVPGVAVVAELGYPRDLLDRGRVNLVTTNDNDQDLVVLSKQLVADHFEPAPADERRSLIPAGGRRVALQTAFGTVAECDDPAPVGAVVVFTYLPPGEAQPQRSAFPVDDATVLDAIRARECTARMVLATNEIAFGPADIDDETVTVDLTLTRLSEPAPEELAVEAIVGTVLFKAEAADPSSSRRLPADEPVLVLPLRFTMNRCDPHAVAETTKKFGLDLWLSVGGAEAQPVPMPIDPLLEPLETILERCKARNAS